MSTFKVTAERLIVHPHPNADLIELAQVGEYRAVIAKGSFKTGDMAIYIPEQSIIPDDLIEELGLVGKLAGSKHNRVKAIRLRGELSQGIVCVPQILVNENVDLEFESALCTDFAERLGIMKWVPEVPSCLSGVVEPAPNILRWLEIEDIKMYPNMFIDGEQVEASEKIHGSCCCITYDIETNELLVSSKGLAGQSLSIVESENNLYWRAVKAYGIAEKIAKIAKAFDVTRIAIFGEVYGKGVQDLHYGTQRKDTPGFAVFDMRTEFNGEKRWLEQNELRDICMNYNLQRVPVLFSGPYNYEKLAALSEGKSIVYGAENIREGIVVRSVPERYSSVTGNRAIAKFLSPSYITRSGGTEYE